MFFKDHKSGMSALEDTKIIKSVLTFIEREHVSLSRPYVYGRMIFKKLIYK